MGVFDKQVGGDHYSRLKIQPLQLAYLVADGDSCFCKVAKYLSRDKDDRQEDVQKAIDVLIKASELRKSGVEVTHYKRKMIGEFSDQFEDAPFIAVVLLSFLSANYDKAIETAKALQ